jgi:hypothetical protein
MTLLSKIKKIKKLNKNSWISKKKIKIIILNLLYLINVSLIILALIISSLFLRCEGGVNTSN